MKQNGGCDVTENTRGFLQGVVMTGWTATSETHAKCVDILFLAQRVSETCKKKLPTSAGGRKCGMNVMFVRDLHCCACKRACKHACKRLDTFTNVMIPLHFQDDWLLFCWDQYVHRRKLTSTLKHLWIQLKNKKKLYLSVFMKTWYRRS